MAPEEWPIAAPPEGQGAFRAQSAGRGRLSTVRSDFFLDPAERLTEQERALMTGMIADLLGSIADEIRAAVPPALVAANDGDGQRLTRQLIDAGLLDHIALIDLLLRRADEERISNAVRARTGMKTAFMQALIADPEEEVSAPAMAVILARGRRRDRLGQPRLEYDDLPRWMAAQLAHAVAATLRPSDGKDGADRHLSAAADALAARHDRSRRIDDLTVALARALNDAGRLDDALIAAAAEDGDIAFVAAALAERSEIPVEAAWDHMLDAQEGRFVLLLRMAGLGRDDAAQLLAGLGDLLGIIDPAGEIARFEETEEAVATRLRDRLVLDPAYRSALEALGQADG